MYGYYPTEHSADILPLPDPPDPPEPTDHPPGSPGKVAVLRQRAAAKVALWHAGDTPVIDPHLLPTPRPAMRDAPAEAVRAAAARGDRPRDLARDLGLSRHVATRLLRDARAALGLPPWKRRRRPA